MLKSIIAAFSVYSAIPMPVSVLEEDDLKYCMCAFPFVGLFISLVLAGAYHLLKLVDAGNMLISVVLTLIPVFLTGGIHMDGYMDTTDALRSYGDREKKLAILKDPHVGAFAVIYVSCYLLITAALWYELVKQTDEGFADGRLFYAVCSGFVVSRGLSAISVCFFKKARNEGMVNEMEKAQDSRCGKILVWMLAVFFILLAVILGFYMLLVFIPAVSVFFFYRCVSYKEFGGITGDLAGWFLLKCELLILAASVAAALAGRII